MCNTDRDTDTFSETAGPARLPAQLAERCNGDKGTEIVHGEYFVLGRLEQPRQDNKRMNQPRKDFFHLYSLSPHLPQFQQSAGAIPL
jgi:hypothetical protein